VLRCPECALPHEKELCKWLLYVNPYNKVFERCPKCDKMAWMHASILEKIVEFQCENCNSKYELDISDDLLLPIGKKGK
jgi:ubiquitin